MQIGPRIRFDSHTLGNLVKNLAPVAGTVVGGPLGLLAAGGLSTLGDLGRGKNIGESLRGAPSNIALAGAGEAAGSALGYHGGLGSLTSGGSPAVTAPTPNTPIPTSGGVARSIPAADPINAGVPNLEHSPMALTAPGGGRLPLAQVPNLTSGGGSAGPEDSGGFLGKIASGAGNVADWASNHDKTTAAALGAVGNLGAIGTENRLRSAQAGVQEEQARQAAYALQRQQAQDAALEPLRQAVFAKLGSIGPTTPIPAAG